MTRSQVASRAKKGARILVWVCVCSVVVSGLAASAGVEAARAQERPRADASVNAGGGTNEVGIPFPGKHYAAAEYGFDRQNWDVVQDDRGLIYVANSLDGVLVFDGATWRSVPVTADTAAARPVRSLAVGPDGRVYVGTVDDFGVLRPDSLDRLRYVSLARDLPEAHRDFGDVWNTRSTSRGVYFQSLDRLFRWNGRALQVWTSEKGFHTAFAVGDRLYVRDFGRGLLKMAGSQLRDVPGGDRFQDVPIFSMTTHPSGKVLIGSAQDGLFVHDETGVRPFNTEVDAVLADEVVYDGVSLPDGRVALATLGAGVLVLDAQGRIDQWLRPDVALPDGVVNALHVGRSGELWMAFNNAGVMRASVASALSVYDERLGLKGTIHDVVRHEGRLFVATGVGLFTLASERPGAAFQRVDDVPLAHELASTNQGLFAAAQTGLFRVRDGGADRVTERNVTAILQSTAHPDRIYAAGPNGLVLVQPSGAGWRVRTVPAVTRHVQALRERGDVLWTATASGRVQRVQLAGPDRSDPASASAEGTGAEGTGAGRAEPRPDTVAATVRSFGPEEGLQGGYAVLGTWGDTLTVATQSTVFRLTRDARGAPVGFEPAPSFVPGTARTGPIHVYLTDEATASVWAMRGDAVYHGHASPGRPPAWHDVDALHFPKEEPMLLYPDADAVWIGVGNRLLRYDLNAHTPTVPPFQALVRSVTTIEDSTTVYGGAARDAEASLQVPYDANDLRFTAAAPLFNTVNEHRYRFWLEGDNTDRGEADWSAWTTRPEIAFTDLSEGTYRLHVEARNERGARSLPAVLAFRVAPPWYRTVWAYGVYGGLIVALVVAGWKYRRLRVESRRARRASRRNARELASEQAANRELHQANERLRQVNELKENFLVSTSHELRTPITNILGFTDLVRDEAPDDLREHLDVISANGERLLRTLNALLDLASLRAGEMHPQFERVNVLLTVLGVVKDRRAKATEKGLSLEVDVPTGAVYAQLDERFLEQILRNLVDNAIKFTDAGTVWVRLDQPDDAVAITVEDPGIGIDPDFIPDLFRDFKQESKGMARTYEGSGLGLAITARLVDRMNGTITVDSEKGEGSTFTVRFPRLHAPEAGDGAASPPHASRNDASPNDPTRNDASRNDATKASG